MTLKRKTKILSLLLTLALLFTLLPATAWAAAATGTASGTAGYDSIGISLSGASQFSTDTAVVQDTSNWTLTPTGGTQTIQSVTKNNDQYVRIVLSDAVQAGQAFTIDAAEVVFAAGTESFSAPLNVNITIPTPATGTATASTGAKDIAVTLTGGSFGSSSAVQNISLWTLGGDSAPGNPIASVTYVDSTHATVTLTNNIDASDIYTITAAQPVFVNAAIATFDSSLSVTVAGPSVCEISGTPYATLDDALAAVPTGGATATVIKLLQDINYTGGMTVSNKKITFDLNGKTLTVENDNPNTGAGLYVSGGSVIDLINPGAFNITGSYTGLEASACTVRVTSVNTDNSYGVKANNSVVTVTGNVASAAYMGVAASGGSRIDVGGDTSGASYGVYAQDANTAVTVAGSVYATGVNGTGVHSRDGAAVTVLSDVVTVGNNCIGANLGAYGTLTVDGIITAERYLVLEGVTMTAANKTAPTTKAGYKTYIGGSSTVWVALTAAEGICEISGTYYGTLDEALGTVGSGQTKTIRLISDITDNKSRLIDGKNITFDLNSFDLTIDASSADDAALAVKNGGKVGYSGNGSFRVIGQYVALNAEGPGDEVTVSYAETTADTPAGTVQASNGGKVTVKGDVLSGGEGFYGLWAVLGGQITVDGKVTAYNTGVYSSGINSMVIVKNGVTMTSLDGTGVIARNGGKAEITGDITAGKCGVAVDGSADSAATVTGSVTVTGTATGLNPEIAGVQVGGYGSASVTGSVTVSGTGCTGIYSNASTVHIGGQVASAALGAEAVSGGKITIDGSLTAAGPYIKVGTVIKSTDGYESTSTISGYREYKNGGNIAWVKIPSASVWPAGSVLTADNTTDTSTVLSWTAATGALDYCVYKNNAFEGGPGANTRTYTVTGLTPNTDYTFKVQAAYLEGASGKWTTDGPSVTIRTSAAPPASTYILTVVNGTGSSSYVQGAAVSVTANVATSGQTFDKWTSSDGVAFANASSASTTFTMPGKNVTVTATYKNTGGGSSGGGTPSTPETPTYKADVKEGVGTETTIPVVVNKDTGTASVDASSQKLTQGRTVIRVPSIPDVDTYSVGISVPDLSTTAVQGTLTFHTDMGSVIVPSNMLMGVSGIQGSKAEISIGQGDKSSLPEDVQAAVGDKPLIQLTLSINGKRTNWSNPSALVTVNIPYTPTVEELNNSEGIVIWYIDGSGNVSCVPNGHYDPRTGTVIFSPTHFSDYAVAYSKVSFNDVSTSAWYANAVGFIASRGITTGTGNGKYSPNAKLTRGEFIVLIMRAYGISPDANPTNNFSDAGSTYYTGYLAAAKRLGITSGVGNNMYAPGNQITRQEMFTLVYNALKVIGQLPQGVSGKKVLDFTDAAQISDWASEAMEAFVVVGTVGGSNDKLNPTGTTTRAEMAQVLYNLLGK